MGDDVLVGIMMWVLFSGNKHSNEWVSVLLWLLGLWELIYFKPLVLHAPVVAIFDLSMLAGSTESLCLPAGVSIRWMPSLLLFGCFNAIYCVGLYRVLLAGWSDEFSVPPGVFLRMQAVFKKCTHSAGLQRSHLKPDVLWDCSHN